MQIRKQKGTSPAHPPPLEPRHQMPTSRRVGRAITPVGRKWNIAGRRKETKLKRILLLGYRLSLFSPFHSWLGVVLCDERGEWTGGIKLHPPPHKPQCPSEERKKRLRVLPEGTPGLSQHQLHICSLVADTRMTPADPRVKTLIKNLSPPVAYSSLPTDCT